MPSLVGRASASLVRRTDQFMRDLLHLRINARSLVFYYLGQVRETGPNSNDECEDFSDWRKLRRSDLAGYATFI